jgi:hypothetical protein
MNDSKSSLRLLFESRACDGTDQSTYDGDFVCFHRSAPVPIPSHFGIVP